MPYADVAVILVLILLNGFFAMSELAIVSSRRPRLQQMEKRGSRGATYALALGEDPTSFLSTVQVGITLIGIFAGAYSGEALGEPLAAVLREIPAFAGVARTMALVIVVVGTTYASLIIGELVPKRLALQNPEAVAVRVALPMTMLARAGTPIVWFLRVSTDTVLRLLGVSRPPSSDVSEEEVKAMIAEGAETGVFHQAERRMLERVLRFADQPARAIMAPRHDLVFLDADAPIEDAVERISVAKHSRYPLCEGGNIDEVIGVVHVKDVLALAQAGGGDLRGVREDPLFVSPNLPALELVERFRESRVHMALVVDEYGDLEGVVTPLDVLHAIAGRLPEAGHDAGPGAFQREDGSWLMDGDMNLGEAAAILGLDELEAEGYATLAGLALDRLGELPEPGAVFDAEGWRFEVVDLDGRRIDKLIATKLPAREA
ncbi:hemolysin family protein [Amaricoccus sp.]|uniref:hemolysin family protein n=1 Tax=Amaricoccus sp. TaxID=1872485 RepID=UPI001B4D9C1E|nr:hemolysin family protein [Amaricoccus sp.]MBP7002389.1 HlyC/CorC family transporter [Amaricoccus sp.]